MISEDLLEILACPYCRTDVRLDDDEVLCPDCGRRYPIKDGIPHMLPDELR